MYWDHFNLSQRPFSITPDPSLMIWTKQHAQIYDALKQEALSRAPMTLLTGDVGCGKTTLLRALLEDPFIAAQCRSVLISIRLGSARELLQHLLFALLDRLPEGSDEDCLRQLCDALDRPQPDAKALFIILDEAQTMAPDVAILLARLARGDLTATQPPAVLIAGQPELTGLLSRADLRPLSAAIGQRLRLGPLSHKEVGDFIFGRLAASGCKEESLFSDSAIKTISDYSRGVPRLVNKLCDLCLFMAAQQKCQIIDAEFTREVLAQFSPLGGAITTSITQSSSPDVRTDLVVFPKSRTSEAKVDGNFNQEDISAELLLRDEPAHVASEKPVTNSPVRTIFEPEKERLPGLPATFTKLEVPPPKSRSAVFGYMRGALVAAVLAVPLLLVLPKPEMPVSSSGPLSMARVGSGSGAPVPGATVSTPLGQPQALRSESVSFGDEGDATTTIPTVELEESSPVALSQSILSVQAEKEALEAELRRARALAERSAAELAVTREELAALRLKASDKREAFETPQLQMEAEQNQLAALTRDVSTTEESLTTLQGDIGTSQKLQAPTDLVGRSAFQPGTIEPFGSAIAADIPQQTAILAIAPLMPSGDEGSVVFFDYALESTNPGETALNYARAAIRGHRQAAIYLGQLFETGDGVTFDTDMAQRWYAVSKDMERLHHPDLAAGVIGSVSGSVETLGAFVSGDTADLIWQGKASVFTVQLADADARPIAYISTPLNAVRVPLPDGARFWRVTTADGTSSDWQPLETSTD